MNTRAPKQASIWMSSVRPLLLGLLALCLAAGSLPARTASAASGPDELIDTSITVMKEIQAIPDGGVPQELLDQCVALAIIPSVYKAGFIIGASYGRGILVAKDLQTGKWNGPVFIDLGGGSLGWQIGVEASDVVLVVMNPRGLNSLLKNNLTLGGDVSVAAGPVGRHLQASTDMALQAAIYSYSRSKGFFAGLSLAGAYLKHEYGEDERFYGRVLTPTEILAHGVSPTPPAAMRLQAYLNSCCGGLPTQ